MRVLVACEYSGRVRDAFLKRGHDAMSCDTLPTEVPGPHYQGDVLDILDDGWDLMIAHPPCTYLATSGLHWNSRGRMVNGRPRQELTEEALEFVRKLLGANIPKIGLENPKGCISTRIRPADQLIHPYQFGHDASKATYLWLKNLPPLKGTRYIEPRWTCCGILLPEGVGRYGCANCNGDGRPLPRWANQCDKGQSKLGPSKARWRERSRTYQGWADAMADQWGGDVVKSRPGKLPPITQAVQA